MANKFKISATSIDEFQAISEAVNSLPVRVVEQIRSAEKSLLGIECTFYSSLTTIYLPKEITHIKEFENYTAIYCGEFFFRIPDKLKQDRVEYIFFDELKS